MMTQREAFEQYMIDDLLFNTTDLEIPPGRNAYRNLNIHIAWCCWRASASFNNKDGDEQENKT